MKERTFKFDKLIRDKMYEIMLGQGSNIELKKVSSKEELLSYFKLKLTEETEEVATAIIKDDLVEELADCLEVIHGFASALDISFNDIEAVRLNKLTKRGGFSKHLIVDTLRAAEDKQITKYCLKYPEKYPEIDVP